MKPKTGKASYNTYMDINDKSYGLFLTFHKIQLATKWHEIIKTMTTAARYEYVCALEGQQIIKRVRFQVDALNDIHISLSKTNPCDTHSFEIVLGAGNATWSTIRSGHVPRGVGRDLVSIWHTSEQYDQLRQNFELRIGERSIGLYDARGKIIVRYDGYDSSEIEYLFISGWSTASGTWRIESLNPYDPEFDPDTLTADMIP